MDIEGVRKLLHQKPFEPFVIHLADGRSLPVPDPDFVALTAHRVIVGADDDSWSFVDPFAIVSLDALASKFDGVKRGAKKKRP
jgi:hypothetical protein